MGENRKVLIIDDNIDCASITAEMLGLSGYDTCFADSGEHGLTKALQWPVDIVIIDIGMPDLDGFDVAEKFREHPAMANVVLISYTGYSTALPNFEAKSHVFDGIIQKPATVENFIEVLDRAYTHRRTSRSAIYN